MQTGSRIVLCRHGVTDFTTTGKWDGRGGANPGLNRQGRDQARDLAARLSAFLGDSPEVRVLSSSLRRAKETAAPVAELFGMGVRPIPDWDELAFGEWDGLTGEDLRREKPDEVLRFWGDETFRIPGGESHVDLHSRVRPAFERVLRHRGTAVVVTHWGPIMSCISLVLGIDLLPARRLNLAPASMTSIVVGREGPQVEFVNDLGIKPIVQA
mgnify:CR=1 FL=1